MNRESFHDILDIGGESTRPGAQAASPQMEFERINPLLELLKENNYKGVISIDTRNVSVLSI